MRIGIYDIEATNLDANFGYALCGVVKPWGYGKAEIFKISKPPDDKEFIERFVTRLGEFDAIVGWYSSKFDAPFLQTRLLLNGSRMTFPRILHKDLILESRKYLKFHSNRLEAVSSSLGCKHSKTRLDGQIWTQAPFKKEALDYVVQHCVADVHVLEEVANKLKKYIRLIREG